MRATLIGACGIFLTLGNARTAFGGDEMGNGGHVVACRASTHQVSYQALDTYEAARKSQLFPALPAHVHDEFAAAAVVLRRLERLDTPRMERYLRILRFMRSTHKFIAKIPSDLTNDFESAPLRRNCELEQAIFQLKTPRGDLSTFLIHKPIWRSLNGSDRVILILHEVIYWDAIRQYGQTTSAATRQFNALIFSNAIEQLDESSYDDVLKSLNFYAADVGE